MIPLGLDHGVWGADERERAEGKEEKAQLLIILPI